MNVNEWGALGTAAAAVVGWFVRIEGRFGRCLTRAEHSEICETRNREISDKLEVIREDIRELRRFMVDR